MDIWYHNDMMGSGMTDLGCGKSWLSTLNEMEDSIRDLQEFVGGGYMACNGWNGKNVF